MLTSETRDEKVVQSHLRRARLLGTVAATLVLPAVALVVLLRQLGSLPPIWAWYLDPTYPYLLNGALIVQGGTPGHTDHPGTSFQWLLGGVEWIVHLFRGNGLSLSADVVANAEFYMNSSGGVLVGLFCVSLGYFGYRLTGAFGPVSGVVSVLLILAGLGVIGPWIMLLTPESLVVTCAVFVLALLAPVIADRAAQPRVLIPIMVGLLVAIGMTAKIVFLPMVLVLPFCLRWRPLAVAAGSVLVSASLILIPIYSEVDRMLAWFFGVASNPGRYGDEPGTKWTVGQNLWSAAGQVGQLFQGFWIIMFLCLAILTYSISRRPIRKSIRTQVPAVGLVLAIAATLALGYKSFTARDFVVLVPLVAVLAGLTLRNALTLLRSNAAGGGRLLRIIPGACLVACLALALLGVDASTQVIEGKAAGATARVGASELLDESPANAWTAMSYGVQTPASALMFGDAYARRNFASFIGERFPRQLEYSLWDRRLSGWDADGTRMELGCAEVNTILESGRLNVVVADEYVGMLERPSTDRVAFSNGFDTAVSLVTPAEDDSPYTVFRITSCEAQS